MQRSDWISLGLVSSGVNRLYSRLCAGPGFSILAWHEVTASRLEAQLRTLDPWFEVVSLEDALARAADPVPRRRASRTPLVLTFDDGYSSWLTEVLPVLRARKLPALGFVCPGFVWQETLPWYEVLDAAIQQGGAAPWDEPGPGVSLDAARQQPKARRRLNRWVKGLDHASHVRLMGALEARLGAADRARLIGRYLNPTQLQLLAAGGLEIGAHSLTHPRLSSLDDALLAEEVGGSRRRLEAWLQRPVRYFAYPNGLVTDIDQRVMNAVRQAGLEAALTALPGWNGPGGDRLLLRRSVAVPGGSPWRLRATASGLLGNLESVLRQASS